MACTAPRIGERQLGLHAAEHDFLAQDDVRRVGDHLHQVAIDQAHGFQRVGVGQRAVAGGNERLDRMHQRIDAGTGGQERVHAGCGFRVDQRHIRHHRLADDGELHALLLVGNDHELRDIRRGAGGGRDQDQRGAGHANGVHAFEFEDVAPMGDHNADGLAAIHRATAADGHDHVAMVVAVHLGTEHDFFDTRVGRDAAVQAVIDTDGLQAGFHIGDPAGGDHTGVADHQHFARTKGLGVITDVVPATGTKDDFRRNEFTQEAEIWAHWKACFYFFWERRSTLTHPRVNAIRPKSHSPNDPGQREAGRG